MRKGDVRMNLATKNRLSDHTIFNLVRSHFGSDWQINKIDELNDGQFNSAYLITGNCQGKADALVLKIAPSSTAKVLTYEHDIMMTEIDTINLLREQTSLSIPKIRAVSEGKNLLGSRYFFMEKLQGVPLNKVMRKLSIANLSRIKTAIGEIMAEIHKIKGDYFGYYENRTGKTFPTWKEAYLDYMKNILSDGKAGKIKLPYERIERVLDRNSHYLEDVKEAVLVNYDLWPGNIFVIDNQGEYSIEGIVDLERSFWGDPLADIPSTVMMFKDLSTNLSHDKTLWKRYCELMHRPPSLSKSEIVRIHLYYLYLWIIMIVETYRYSKLFAFLQAAYARNKMNKTLRILEKA